MCAVFKSSKRTQIVSPGNEKNASAEDVVVADFFAYSQRQHDPWIDRAVVVDPAKDVDLKNMKDFFFGLFHQMRPDGRLTILTRPHDCSHYPFFPALADFWKRAHPPVTFYSERLQNVGFDVKMKSASLIINTSSEAWISELKSIPAFEDIDESDMTKGIEELEMMIDYNENVSFEEKLVVITAVKPRDGKAMDTLIVQEEGPPYGHCG